jgi:hypothetical protein
MHISLTENVTKYLIILSMQIIIIYIIILLFCNMNVVNKNYHFNFSTRVLLLSMTSSVLFHPQGSLHGREEVSSCSTHILQLKNVLLCTLFCLLNWVLFILRSSGTFCTWDHTRIYDRVVPFACPELVCVKELSLLLPACCHD